MSGDTTKKGLSPEEKAAKHAYSIHQDQLLWSRVQTLIAIQTATLAGTYYLGTTKNQEVVAVLVTLLGLVLTGLLWIIVERDQIYRESSRIQSGVPKTEISPQWKCLALSGGTIVRLVFLILASSDLIVLLISVIGAWGILVAPPLICLILRVRPYLDRKMDNEIKHLESAERERTRDDTATHS